MTKNVFYLDIDVLLKQFLCDVRTCSSQNYRMLEVLMMIVATYKIDNQVDISMLSRFCMYFSDTEDNVRDAQIMCDAIMNLKNELFLYLNVYGIINMSLPNNPYLYQLRVKSLNGSIMGLEATNICQ